MKIDLQKIKTHYPRWIALSILSGILAGLSASVFLASLDWVTETRFRHAQLIYALPLGGLFIAWIYQKFGKDADGGTHLIIDEIHNPKNVITLKTAPLVFIATLITHLFGGSAGREGAAVQISATLSDQLSRFFRISNEDRKILLVAGAGAGFGAAIGTPWAGVIFGMEIIDVGRLRPFAIVECFIASFVGCFVTHLIGVHHIHFPAILIPGLSLKTTFFIVVAGIAFGLAARVFLVTTHLFEKFLKRFVSSPLLRPVLAGFLIVILYRVIGTTGYAGLGFSEIRHALVVPNDFSVPALKSLFTTLTVGSGFKGGEFVPLVFVGVTLGSALGLVLPVAFPLLAATGFAAVFAAAANTPIACSVMAAELFGVKILPYALLACFSGFFVSGYPGLYRTQRLVAPKHELLWGALSGLKRLIKKN